MTNEEVFAVWAESVLDAAKAHRQMALQKGFSNEAAEAMAVTLHSVLMAGLEIGVDNPPEE